jgi:hypothetical protein
LHVSCRSLHHQLTIPSAARRRSTTVAFARASQRRFSRHGSRLAPRVLRTTVTGYSSDMQR